MFEMIQSLLAGCFGAALMWWLLKGRSAAAGESRPGVEEIDQLRTAIDELTSALEQRADAVERRLSRAIAEAQAVDGVLDRALTAVGRQILQPELASSPLPSEEPADPGEAPDAVFVPEELSPVTSHGVHSVSPVRVADDEHVTVPGEVPEGKPSIPPFLAKAESELDDRGSRVLNLVASGTTDSVQIARETGLTRGEVELILILHNHYLSPDGDPGQAAGAAASELDASDELAPAIGVDDRYKAIYALVASGVTDSVEIARRTGLGRGEVELHLGLHARNVL